MPPELWELELWDPEDEGHDDEPRSDPSGALGVLTSISSEISECSSASLSRFRAHLRLNLVPGRVLLETFELSAMIVLFSMPKLLLDWENLTEVNNLGGLWTDVTFLLKAIYCCLTCDGSGRSSRPPSRGYHWKALPTDTLPIRRRSLWHTRPCQPLKIS